MNKKCGIYKITSPTGKVYIGQSTDIKRRFNSYKRIKESDHPKLYNSIKKYGYLSHTFDILEECGSLMLDEKEIYYIKFFDSIKTGLNCRDGGARGKLSKDSLKKLSESLKLAAKNPETKRKRSEWQIGRKMSEESKVKMRIAAKNRKPNINQIKSAKGNKYAQKSPIEIYLNGIFHSVGCNLYEAAKIVNGDFRNVQRAIKTGGKHKGFTFKRVNESNFTKMG